MKSEHDDHVWVQENLAAYLAGGLEEAEADRVEQHAADCRACEKALREGRTLNRQMEAIFSPVRPMPGLEDHLIQALRKPPAKQRLRWPWYVKLGLGAAAALFVGTVGAVTANFAVQGRLPFPGEERAYHAESRNSLRLHGLAAPEHRFPPAMDGYAQGSMGVDASDFDGEAGNGKIDIGSNSSMDNGTALMPRKDGQPLGRSPLSAFKRKEGGFGEGRDQDGDHVSNLAGETGKSPPSQVSGGWGFGLGDGKPGMPGSDGGVHGVTALSSDASKSSEKATSSEAKDRIADTPDRRESGVGNPNQSGAIGAYPPSRGLVKAMPRVNTTVDGTAKFSGSVDYYSYKNDSSGKTPLLVQAPVEAKLSGVASTSPAPNVAAITEQWASLPDKARSGFKPGEVFPKSAKQYSAPGKESKGDSGEDKSQDGGKDGRDNSSRPADSGTKENSGKEGEKKPEPALGTNSGPGQVDPGKAAAEAAGPRKIIIRSGDVEFEIDSFDAAVATVTKLINGIKGAFVATVNSDKLANGKVKGSMVVRMPPEALDSFVLDLRKELGKVGELKGLRIGSRDITKEYTDLESRLRAARAMEERLLNIIKTGKGEIKDLLQAEKELGVWRTKIEEFEGELRYFANLVSLSTLTITLHEKDIRAPFALSETEKVQMGIEVEDVDNAYRAALAAVEAAKGRVTKSEVKQQAAGQFNAVIQFEVAPESSGPMRDRLKQLGSVARLDIDRVQQSEGGSGKPQDTKVKRNDSQFFVSLYNLVTVTPRETVHVKLACIDVEAAYKTILARVDKAAGRVVASTVNRQRSDNTTGNVQFEVKSAEADAVLLAVKEAGEVMNLQTTENPDVQNVTRAKRGFRVELWALAQVAPRETATLQVASKDVPASYRALQEAVAKAKGRTLDSQLNERDKQNITAKLDFEVRRDSEAEIRTAVAAAGDTFSRTVTRAQDKDDVIDSKVRYQVELLNLSRLKPREIFTLAIEVGHVDQTAAALTAMVADAKGQPIDSTVNRDASGQETARLIFDVPLTAASGMLEKLKGVGTVRVLRLARTPEVPDSELARARLDVTLSNAELIVPSDQGLWPQVRKGLATSFHVLLISVSYLIFGVCVLLPWAVLIGLMILVGIRIFQRFRKNVTPTAA